MTHQEFHEAVRALAGGDRFATKVELSTSSNGRFEVACSANIAGAGWTDDHDTAEGALSELRATMLAKPPSDTPPEASDEIPRPFSLDGTAELST